MALTFEPFGDGGAVKLWEEKADLVTDWINYEAVFRAAPGLARLC